MAFFDPRIGGFFSARNILVASAVSMLLWLATLPATPAQAALAGFVIATAIWLRLASRRQLEAVGIERDHRPRVFERDPVEVILRLTRGRGFPIQMLELEDQFLASLDVRERHLVPVLGQDWEVLLHYNRTAERHRGLYVLGPIQLRGADPLGVFVDAIELPTFSRLTVYPRTLALPFYTIPAPNPPTGASMDAVSRVGQGEEVLSVREYRRGDSPSRVHWRTSARRRRLHVVELNRPIQAELAVLLDLTRRTRFGTGAEATDEMAVRAAIQVLTRALDRCHRFSLAIAREELEVLPAGSGLHHIQLLLDRLSVIQPAGEIDFWRDCAPRALTLGPGSRAVPYRPGALHAPGRGLFPHRTPPRRRYRRRRGPA